MAARLGFVRGAVAGLVLEGLLAAAPGGKPYGTGEIVAIVAGAFAPCAILGALIAMFYNMGLPHEEAALYGEAVHEIGTPAGLNYRVVAGFGRRDPGPL